MSMSSAASPTSKTPEPIDSWPAPGPAPRDPAPGLARGQTGPAGDRDLLRAHLGGDPRAFPELIGRHQRRMASIAMRTLRNHEDAADAVQEAILRAVRAARSYRGDAEVSHWLQRIVANTSVDALRRRQQRPDQPHGGDLLELPTRANGWPSAAATDVEVAVDAALQALPPAQRIAIVLVDMEGYSVAETAVMVGVPDGTIKSRCSRGRARLAEMLAVFDP